ncbi:hypothetical protein POTOM_033749 [Populus tomentosa]|uniref:CN hydrolase domain-containing protein n=1 Tax=Populus tomentosa TaxID=118781 RepID=A0A8X7Z620_POPTO|nr:hypothetical protein POTOM_033749 [Populus tomentosa]
MLPLAAVISCNLIKGYKCNITVPRRLVRAAHKKGANIILIQITYFPVELVFQAKFAKIRLEEWFLEEARAMALQDAEIVLYPTAIVSEPQDQGLDSRDHWKQVMQGHAGANLVSCCTGPAREIVAAADDKEEAVLVSKFDLEQIRLMRHSWGVFHDWRPGLYKVLLTSDGSNLAFLKESSVPIPGIFPIQHVSRSLSLSTSFMSVLYDVLSPFLLSRCALSNQCQLTQIILHFSSRLPVKVQEGNGYRRGTEELLKFKGAEKGI